jgi:hypothetical protein
VIQYLARLRYEHSGQNLVGETPRNRRAIFGAFPTNDCPKWFNIWQGCGIRNSDVLPCAGNFTGALHKADVLNWQPGAKDAWSLALVSEDLRKAAETHGLAYEAHHFGLWLPDFWCARSHLAACVFEGALACLL